MKRILYMAVPLAISLAGCSAWMQTTYEPSPQPVYTNGPPPDYNSNSGYTNGYPDYDDSPQTDQVFYDELSPYGQWVDYPDYGYVWAPNAGPDFRPYATNGYWTYTDYGWTWISKYNWGWAPFHYGRWFYDDYYGWMWMPGHEWAPAWVNWGSYGDYYCWAPIAPRTDVRVISSNGWRPPANSWNVVQRRRITQIDINNYIVRTNAAVIKNVAIVNNYNTNDRVAGSTVIRQAPVYNRGPRLNDVENVTNSRINTIRVNDNRKPGAQVISNNQLSVYRPVIKQTPSTGIAKPAPRKVESKPGRVPNNPQQTQPGNRPDNNPGSQPNHDQRPNNPQQTQPGNRPDNNPGSQPNHDQRPNNPQQTQPGNRPDNNPGSQPNHDQRPNNPQQTQPGNRPDNNLSPQPNQNQQQIHRPDINNDPGQKKDQKPNNPAETKPAVNPDINRDPAQRQILKPNNPQVNPGSAQNQNPGQDKQTPESKAKTNFWGTKRPAQAPVKKTDPPKRVPNKQ